MARLKCVMGLVTCAFVSASGGFNGFGQEPKSIEHCEQILDMRERLAAIEPDNLEAQQSLAIAQEDLSRARLRFGDVAEGLTAAQAAVDTRRKVLEAKPDDFAAQRGYGVALESLGNSLLQAARFQEALEVHQERLERSRQLAENNPGSRPAQLVLGIAYQNLGVAQAKYRRYDEALEAYRQMVGVMDKLVGTDPKNARYTFALFVGYQRSALMLAALRRFDEAADTYEQGLDLLRAMKDDEQLLLANQKWIEIGELVVKMYRRASMAVGDWDAIMAQPTDLQVLLLELRGTEFARDGRYAEAERAATKLRELKPKAIWPLYSTACVYALCANALDEQAGLADSGGTGTTTRSDPKLIAERERLIAETLAALRQAFDAGWDDIAHLQSDIDMATLRPRPEYQQLVDELKAKIKANDPDLQVNQ